MFKPVQVQRAIYDEDYGKALTLLSNIVEKQQEEIKELKEELNALKDNAVTKL